MKMDETHSPKFSMVKTFYKRHLWTTARVKNAVAKEWITSAEYEEIVGEPYEG